MFDVASFFSCSSTVRPSAERWMNIGSTANEDTFNDRSAVAERKRQS